MLVRVLLAAIVAGVLGGVFATAAQAVRLTPIIIEAEAYERGLAPSHSHGAETAGHSHDAATGAGEATVGDWERTFFTLVSNIVVTVGFALVVTAAMLLTTGAMTLASGPVWGVAGFVTFVLAPNLGLPPELPGTVAADLAERQLWWLATVVATGAGLAIFAFKRHPAWMIAGVALIAAPHVHGAPQPEMHDSLAPAHLAVEFVVVSVATAFVYWLVLGALLGWLIERAMRQETGGKARSA